MSGGKAKKRRDKERKLDRDLTPEEVLQYAALMSRYDVWQDPETGEIRISDKEDVHPEIPVESPS